MDTILTWSNRSDSRKLALITLVMFPLMLVALSSDDLLVGIMLLGAVLCGYAAYWLGNWKWIALPLLAMAVEIICAVPLVMRNQGAGETPVSVILEAPFWTGIPTFIGAGVGYLAKRIQRLKVRGAS
jgi:hypothetical protein